MDDEHILKSPYDYVSKYVSEKEADIVAEITSELQINFYFHREVVSTNYFYVENGKMFIMSNNREVIDVINIE